MFGIMRKESKEKQIERLERENQKLRFEIAELLESEAKREKFIDELSELLERYKTRFGALRKG